MHNEKGSGRNNVTLIMIMENKSSETKSYNEWVLQIKTNTVTNGSLQVFSFAMKAVITREVLYQN